MYGATAASKVSGSHAMHRRMEDRIAKLCGELVAEHAPERIRELTEQLRVELHQFIQALRRRVAQYPIVAERRVQRGVRPPALSVAEKRSAIAASETVLEGSQRSQAAGRLNESA
jgi:hypothetical protein